MRSCFFVVAAIAPLASAVRLPTTSTSTPRSALRRADVRCEVLPPGWKEVTDKESGKPYYYNAATGVTQWQKPMDRFSGGASSSVRSLAPDCSWRIKLELTAPGSATPVVVTGTVRFAEETGYEPPQGSLLVESCMPEGTLTLGEQSTRWQLSEDPEDRGDSLWIWGLFKEPLYPFILFELNLAAPLEMPVEGVCLPAGQLYCQVDHRRKDGAVQLGEGTITYKVEEKIAADLVGLSEVVYNEPVPCGTIRFLDTADKMSKSYV